MQKPSQKPGDAGSVYLTTKEVAALLRVKERKIYDLAAAGEIPHRRITGKLLFPRQEIRSWIEGTGTSMAEHRPNVLTGSHDPLLDWAVRESGAGLAILCNGSFDGLEVFAQNGAALCGLHIFEDGQWNIGTLMARALRDCVLVTWARRERGLIFTRELEAQGRIRQIADLKGRKIIRRQPGAGASAFFEHLLSSEGLELGDLELSPAYARTENDAAAAIAAGEAEATIGIRAMARQYHLAFLPLIDETFDLLIERRAYFTPPVQRLLKFTHTACFRDKAAALGGYDLDDMGTIRWLSP